MTRLWKQFVSGTSSKTGKTNRPIRRNVVLECEALEERTLMTLGVVAPLLPQSLGAAPVVRVTSGALAPPATATIYDAPKSVLDVQMGLPLLDSKPDAPATLYLDFTGSYEPGWWTASESSSSFRNADGTYKRFNVTTPAFDMDSDPTTFSADEKAMIKGIWARVAEDYAPFNINVTTHYYGTFNDRQALHVAIGGWNDWAGGNGSGISSIGSFSDSAPNTVFVFSNDIVYWHNNYPNSQKDGHDRQIDIGGATATSISHEAGHAFGLYHQSLYDINGNMLKEYNPGNLFTTPIMGDNLSASARTIWDTGENDQGHFQNDMAIIAGANNGFGYRADDHGNTIATADPLTSLKPWQQTGHGIIEQNTDVDAFSFTAAGGPIQVQVDAAQYGPNLIPRLQLLSSTGGFVASVDSGSWTESIIHANVAAGTYYVLVSSFGDYGSVGQYTVAVDQTPVLVASSTTTTTVPPVNGGSVLLTSAVLGQNPAAGAPASLAQTTPLKKVISFPAAHVPALTAQGAGATLVFSTGRLAKSAPRQGSPLDLFFADYALPLGIR